MDRSTSRTKSYSSLKHLLSLCSISLSVVFFLGLISSGGLGLIASLCFLVSKNAYLSAIIFIMIIGGALELILFPLNYARSFSIEHKYGLSRQTFYSWAIDYIKGLLLSSALFIAMFVVFYFFLRNFSLLWWFYAGVAYFFVSIVLARVFPMLVIPMFYKLTKISDLPLTERLKALAQKAGVKILDIYNIGLGAKTSKANAAVCGIGKSKRILLSDTMLEKYSQAEIEVTLAHELSHHKHRHFWKLSFLNFALTVFVLYLIDLVLSILLSYGVILTKDGVIAFPFIAVIFILYNFIMLPLTNLISRRYEIQADRDAISLTENPHALSQLMEKLSEQNLSDSSPGWLTKIFFYDHPPASERIALAENIKNA